MGQPVQIVHGWIIPPSLANTIVTDDDLPSLRAQGSVVVRDYRGDPSEIPGYR